MELKYFRDKFPSLFTSPMNIKEKRIGKYEEDLMISTQPERDDELRKTIGDL